MFNPSCDIDLEHSSPVIIVIGYLFAYDDLSSKRLISLELIKYIVETVIFLLYKPSL